MANEKNLKPFKKGQSGNPNGRPRKSFGSINKELKTKGISPLSKTDLIDAYSIIFNCTESDLDEITNDENTPLALTIIIKELQNKVTRARAMQDYRDYCYGRAKENIDHTTKGKEIKSSSGIDYSKLSMETLLDLQKNTIEEGDEESE